MCIRDRFGAAEARGGLTGRLGGRGRRGRVDTRRGVALLKRGRARLRVDHLEHVAEGGTIDRGAGGLRGDGCFRERVAPTHLHPPCTPNQIRFDVHGDDVSAPRVREPRQHVRRSARLVARAEVKTAIVDEELESVWAGKKPAKEALDNAVQRGNAVLQAAAPAAAAKAKRGK